MQSCSVWHEIYIFNLFNVSSALHRYSTDEYFIKIVLFEATEVFTS